VDHGVDVNKRNYSGETSLFEACRSKNEAIVKYLVEHGADINKEIGQERNKEDDGSLSFSSVYILVHDGETPLFEACRTGNEAIIKYLVEQGANINKENRNGETPFFQTCRSGNEANIKYLVKNGTDVNRRNIYGETPFSQI